MLVGWILIPVGTSKVAVEYMEEEEQRMEIIIDLIELQEQQVLGRVMTMTLCRLCSSGKMGGEMFTLQVTPTPNPNTQL